MEIESEHIDPYCNFLEATLNILEKSLLAKDQRQINQTLLLSEKYKKNIKVHHIQHLIEKCHMTITLNESSQTGFCVLKTELNKDQILFCKTIILVYLTRNNYLKEGIVLSEQLVQQLKTMNAWGNLLAIVYFYRSRCFELSGQFKQVRIEIMEAYRLASINGQDFLQAKLTNLLLRNYLHYNQFQAANHFINKTNFPENNQSYDYVKFLYYSAKIKTVQMDYQNAYSRLMQAIRKSPDNCALGFKTKVHKLIIICELLIGETPQRGIFSQPEFKHNLLPYYELVLSVLKGSYTQYHEVIQKYANVFQKDQVSNLLLRLKQTVISTGLKRISSAYSQIPFSHVSQKLGVPQEKVEAIIAKGIREGVVQGKIVKEEKMLQLNQSGQMYNTNAPQAQLEKRIQYSFQIFDQAHKAIQFKNQGCEFQRNLEDDIPDDIFQMVEDDFDF